MRSNAEEIERFRLLIRQMSRDSILYRMLQKELTTLGHWKQKPRGKPGNPMKGGKQTEFMD
jgi:hypothetical protein